jgi:DNA-binding transcriptional ArsR family regulator
MTLPGPAAPDEAERLARELGPLVCVGDADPLAHGAALPAIEGPRPARGDELRAAVGRQLHHHLVVDQHGEDLPLDPQARSRAEAGALRISGSRSRGAVIAAKRSSGLVMARDCTSQWLYKSNLADATILRRVGAEATFPALADPRRRAMLLLVRDEPRSVNEIAERFDITQQAVSQHLRVLRDAGLVAVRADGQRRLYTVRPEGLESLEAFLAELWPAGLRRLKEAVEGEDA